MEAGQSVPGEVGEAVHSTAVEEEVGVDPQHGLDRALAEDLVHDVLHVPVRPLPGVAPPDSIGRLRLEYWTGERLTAQPGTAGDPARVSQSKYHPGL